MLQVSVNDKKEFSIEKSENGWTINSHDASCDISRQANGMISLIIDGKSYTGIIEKVDRKTKEVSVRVNGKLFTSAIKEPIDLLLINMGMDLKANKKAEPVRAPMPGMVLRLLVEPGQQIKKGDGLIILEAMKMENLLKAVAPGIVKSIKVAEKTAVEKGAILIEME